jgi:hypothetical protein
MPNINLEQWEREFRNTAEADNLTFFRDHLYKLGLPDEPEMLLYGTAQLVGACCAYASLDGQAFEKFLAMQKYRPDDGGDGRYTFTFDLCGKAFGRILVSSKVGTIDLADLYGHPWWEYEVCGYHSFWVSRTDGDDLSNEDLAQIQEEVIYDLRFDYTEDELDIWFDDSFIEGSLLVTVQDVYDSIDDDSED